MTEQGDQTVYLKDYLPPAYLVDQAELFFDLGEESVQVRSKLSLRRNPASSAPAGTVVLQGQDLVLEELRLDGQPLPPDRYRIEGENLIIEQVPEAFELESRVAIRPQDNTALEGLYKSKEIFCTQCEAEGFRKITFFPDRPDVMTRITTTIAADKKRYPVLLSNGNPSPVLDLGDGRHQVTWRDPHPKPCYLFALVAGPLGCIEDIFVCGSGRKVQLRIYVEPHNLDKCRHAMNSLKKAMRWEEEVYNLEYDLDTYLIVAVDDFNMGAMENKGLNIFNSKYVLARPETATDADYQAIEEVVAHEYFHNWTGNRVTCRDWFQLSLKEGLTVFRDQEFSADQVSRAIKRIHDVRELRTSQFAEDAGPLAHSVRPDDYQEINNFYTATVYNKGAELVRMLHTLAGPERFRQGVRHYLRRHDGQAATVEDFVRAIEEVSGLMLRQFMRWYSQAGTPVVSVTGSYSADQAVYEMTVEQRCPATPGQSRKEPFHIPVMVALFGPDGREMPLKLEGDQAVEAPLERVLQLRQKKERFRFVEVAENPVPSLLRGFSAPVRLIDHLDDRQRAFLLQHDRDPFNRWEAGQQLACRVILDLVAGPTTGESGATLPDGLVEGFRRILLDDGLDKGLAAEILSLPSELFLAEQVEEVDVEGIYRARQAVRRQLAVELKQELMAAWEKNRETGPYDAGPMSVGRRSLKNLCLSYLAAMDEPGTSRLLIDSFREAGNMTDRLAALSLLADCVVCEREAALADFYRQAGGDPLVLDKWFAVQARSKLPDTLERVRSLALHPDFCFHNPNRVRSLFGVFSRANPLRFHGADGEGYAFLGEQVMRIDPANPQLAAWLAGAFSAWRRYDHKRRELMRSQLLRIQSAPNLSRDLSEVVSKALQESFG